jgi:hypothetical protein
MKMPIAPEIKERKRRTEKSRPPAKFADDERRAKSD